MTSSASALSPRFEPLEISEEKDPAGPISPSVTAAAADCFLMLKGAFALILPSSSSFCKTRYFKAITEMGEKNKKPLDVPCWRFDSHEGRAKLTKWTPSEHQITWICSPSDFPPYLLQQLLCEGDTFPCVRYSNVLEIAKVGAFLFWPELIKKCDRVLEEFLLENRSNIGLVKKVRNLIFEAKTLFPKTERICLDAERFLDRKYVEELASEATSLEGLQKKIACLKAEGIEFQHIDLSLCFSEHLRGSDNEIIYSHGEHWIRDKHLINLFKAMPELRSLHLGGCVMLPEFHDDPDQDRVTRKSVPFLAGLKKLEYLKMGYSSSNLFSCLAPALITMTALRVLDLSNRHIDLDELEDLWKQLEHLEELNITRFGPCYNRREQGFGRRLAQLVGLRTLKMGGSQDNTILPAVRHLKKLESLTIIDCPPEADLQVLSDLNLREFSLKGNKIKSSFLSFLTNWKNLQSLYLGWLEGDIGLYLPSLPCLVSLTIGVLEKCGAEFGPALAKSRLEQLDLRFEGYWGSNSINGALMRDIKNIKTLYSLSLSGCVEDSIGPELAEMTQLESLTLNAAQLRPGTFACFAKLTSLRSLYLYDNYYDDYNSCSQKEDIKNALYESLRQMPSLDKVKIRYISFSSRAKKALREFNPDLIISDAVSTCAIL